MGGRSGRVGAPPRGARGLQDHGGARLEESWKGRAGGAGGGVGAAQSMPGAGSPPSAPLPARFAPQVRSGRGGGAGGQASSTAAGTLLSTEAKNAEMKPEEDRGSGYVRAATVHSTTATAHGAWGAVFPPRGGAAVIWGRLLLLSSPPESHEMGNAELQGAKTGGPHGAVAAGPSV